MSLPIIPTPEVQAQVISLGTLVADLVGVFAGAFLGALQAAKRKMDIVGFMALGLAAGVGGGILRDTLLQAGPPLALTKPLYLTTAAVGALGAFLFEAEGNARVHVLDMMDALTLGLFAVAGTLRTLEVGLPWGSALLLGVISAVGGGLIRDVLVQRTPAIFIPGPFLAIAAFGASLTALLLVESHHRRIALVAGAAMGTLLRILSVRLGWRLPSRRMRSDPPLDVPESGA